MAGTAVLYRGKNKTQIVKEAFAKYGPDATEEQVNAHFKEYGLKRCEKSMYYTAKGDARRAAGKPTKVKNGSPPDTPAPPVKKQSATAAVREILKTKGLKTETKDVLAALQAKGISCHPKIVYDVRTELRTGKKKKKGGGDVLLGQLKEVRRLTDGKPERFTTLKETVALAGKIGIPRLREIIGVVEELQFMGK